MKNITQSELIEALVDFLKDDEVDETTLESLYDAHYIELCAGSVGGPECWVVSEHGKAAVPDEFKWMLD